MMESPFPADWRVVAASVAGWLHVERGAGNEDAVGYRRCGEGFLVAVADGAGSRPRSATGSRIAVEVAGDVAARTYRDRPGSLARARGAATRFAADFLRAFDERVDALAMASGSARVDYATTVLAVVAHPPHYLYLSVGDCFLITVHRVGGPHLVVAPDHGDGGATTFLTSNDRAAFVHCGVVADPDLTGLVLATDGLVESLLAIGEPIDDVRPYVAPEACLGYVDAFADPAVPAADLATQLQSAEFAATSGDDKTMIVAVRR